MTTPIQAERVKQLRHGENSQIVDDALIEIARLRAINAELLAALKRIEDDDTGGCRCEHDDENCCALIADYCCPFCIAAVAIAKAEGL